MEVGSTLAGLVTQIFPGTPGPLPQPGEIQVKRAGNLLPTYYGS